MTSLVRVARSYIISQAVKEVDAVRLRGEAVEHAQARERRELADGVGDGAGELVPAQVPAIVRGASGEGAKEESVVSKRSRVKGANEARRAGGTSRLRSGAARGRGAGRRRKTHRYPSAVSWPMVSGMGPVSWL